MLSWYRDPSMSTFVYTEADGISTALFAVKSCNRHHIEEQFVQSNVSKQKWELVFKSSKSKWPYITTKLYLDTCKKPDLGSPQIQYFVFLMIWTNPTKKIITVILIHITHCSIQNFDIKHTSLQGTTKLLSKSLLPTIQQSNFINWVKTQATCIFTT